MSHLRIEVVPGRIVESGANESGATEAKPLRARGGRARGHEAEPVASIGEIVVRSDDPALLERTARFLMLIDERLRRSDEDTMCELVELALPKLVEPPSPSMLWHAQRLAEARATLLAEFGAFTSEDLHRLAGSRASNRAALAADWRKARRVFAVEHQGRTLFPAFQFDAEGKPLPVIREVLAALGDRHFGWPTALWFTASNGWLDGRRPVELLVADPGAVVAAAARERDDDAG